LKVEVSLTPAALPWISLGRCATGRVRSAQPIYPRLLSLHPASQ